MKIKDNYILRQVADLWVVLPLGEETLKFNGMIRLNETSELLWRRLETECNREDLAKVLTSKYDVSFEKALEDVDKFLEKLTEVGCLET